MKREMFTRNYKHNEYTKELYLYITHSENCDHSAAVENEWKIK